jgi:hypothetical protein
VVTGTHTAPAAAPGADLFGAPVAEPLRIEGKPMGSRAGRPNKLSRIMASKVQDEHGTTVLEEMVRLGMMKPVDLWREVREAAKEIRAAAQEEGLDLEKLAGLDVVSPMALLRFKADMLATAAPYLHAKRAPEDGKGRAQPVILAFGGLTAADLGRADGVFGEDDLVVDIEAIATEENQALSPPRSDASGMETPDDGEISSETKEIDR